MVEHFFVSDTHFFHESILSTRKLFGSIEEHDNTIVQNWNSVVGKCDRVYHLGDVVLGAGSLHENKRVITLLSKLNGKKTLTLGNHDSRAKIEVYRCFFDNIVGSLKFKGDFICQHFPVHPQQLVERFRANIHGHTHSKNIELLDGRRDPRYVNVSLEQIGYTPISFEVIKENLRKEGV